MHHRLRRTGEYGKISGNSRRKPSDFELPVIFLALLLVPLIELAVLIYIGTQTSVLFTISIVIVAGLLGALLLRFQGFRTLARVQEEMQHRRPPTDAILDGALIAFAGLLLICPGVISDLFGLLLLIPPCRAWIRNRIRTGLRNRVSVQFHTMGSMHEFHSAEPDSHPVDVSDDTIDAEIVRRSPASVPLPPPEGSSE